MIVQYPLCDQRKALRPRLLRCRPSLESCVKFPLRTLPIGASSQKLVLAGCLSGCPFLPLQKVAI